MAEVNILLPKLIQPGFGIPISLCDGFSGFIDQGGVNPRFEHNGDAIV